MLEKYFSTPKTLRRLRSGISGPHIDAFADDLERDGYAPASAVRYIRDAYQIIDTGDPEQAIALAL